MTERERRRLAVLKSILAGSLLAAILIGGAILLMEMLRWVP